MIDRYPLVWPTGQPRTIRRIDARFKIKMAPALWDLSDELQLLGAKNVIISTNAPVSRNGTPYANSNEPSDPGAAVYFERSVGSWNRGQTTTNTPKPFVIACDTYRKLVWNLRAIGMTVEALRTIQRHGASSMLEQAFTGFAALPPADHVKPWWEILGVDKNSTREQIRKAVAELAKIHHPDVGGSHERMAEINAAFERSQI